MKLIKHLSILYFVALHLTFVMPIKAEENREEIAELYLRYCSLCHGNDGMGEGPLPIRISEYPATNLFNEKLTSFDEIKFSIQEGGWKTDLSEYMPPWKDEFSEEQIDQMSRFVIYLRKNPDAARKLLTKVNNKHSIRVSSGKDIFLTQCTLCHGKNGDGNGRMSKIIKSPPPANLIKSRLSDGDLIKIVSDGGVSINRSPQMPPWKDQLSETGVKAVIEYIKSIRR